MKKVFIKYNPYKLETELTVNGKKLKQNSKIGEKIFPGSRLQDWVEDLPRDLIDEYNDTDFDIQFHGTLLDYEDLTEVFTQAYERNELTAKLERIPAKETSDKEVLVEKVFGNIQKGPFDELRDPEIISAFQHARSSEFEVCVVATMSAGKSTLINAMLGQKLMPSKQEACTAIITRLKDNDQPVWKAKVYDKNKKLIETDEKLTYKIMERLNDDKNVSTIEATGNIPFVSAEDLSLVLIDTPGPNNARDPEHRKVQSDFLNGSSKTLVLYIMEGTFGSDDDNDLLQRVADSMNVGGKQSKDRFIFVINKVDNRNEEDGSLVQTLDRVRDYLKKQGIVNPNLFPAAALPALNIRLMQNGMIVDEDIIDDEIMPKVRKLNRTENLHLENYASLPKRRTEEIKAQLQKSGASENDKNNADNALIHSGVISIEAAISQYVQKYAKTAKIKNVVDTFMHKLDELDCLEKTKQELAKNREYGEEIAKQIETVRKKVDDAKVARQFQDDVQAAVIKAGNDSENTINRIVQKYQGKITKELDKVQGRELAITEVKSQYQCMKEYARGLEPEFKAELEELVQNNLIKTGNNLLEEYRKKLFSLATEVAKGDVVKIDIDPLKIMGGSVINNQLDVEKLIKSKDVEDGKEFIKNTNKKWYKPWTWFEEDGYWKKKCKQEKFIPAGELAELFFSPIQESLWLNGQEAKDYVNKQACKIVDAFFVEFDRLDGVLKQKLQELESYAKDKKRADARIKETEKNLAWLEEIKKKIDAILEI